MATARELPAPALDEKHDLESGASSSHDGDVFIAPSEEEKSTLRKVAGGIPKIAYLICIVELAERASFYGAKGPFNNYMQFPLPKGGDGTGAVPKSNPNGHAGALNKGIQFASSMTIMFNFLSYTIPIFGAWLADAKIGRFKAIIWGVIIGGVAHIILIGGAAPSILKAGHGVAPFLVSLIMLAVGAGIFKPNVSPLLLDQYTEQKQYVKTLKSGERVIVDPETSIQRIMLIFYSFINVGAFFAIACVYAEKYLGFWIAYLFPGIVYFLLPFLLIFINKRLVKKPPMGSEMVQFFKIIGTAIKQNKGKLWGKGFWDRARPSTLSQKGINVSWSDKDVSDVYRTLVACQIFLYFPIWFINDGGIGAVQSNQGAAMTSQGAPNDLLGKINPLTIIVVSPLLSHGLYPLLNKYNIKFGRISRITFGFVLAAISGMVGAVIQHRVYQTSPCGYQASTCDGVSPISIWWQLPNVMLGAISELFVNVTGYELAYSRSPPHMKSLVLAMFLFNTALSSALSLILVPAIKDPYLTWVWGGPAIALAVQTIIFWWRHRGINDEEFMIYEEEAEAEQVSVEAQGQKKA
ncbi:PTR2-domain-containing protein [Corynespora cassiicola Philippines]|uniref:PTR2-domain-containing protein n=1 Tax=Corynespora cassiicola Philippines TaxID=1448308 RepID=A0A2T2N5H0_CORCC|nr:PTR2-domain-containing protein [Corynespora cassiicola Philippines]